MTGMKFCVVVGPENSCSIEAFGNSTFLFPYSTRKERDHNRIQQRVLSKFVPICAQIWKEPFQDIKGFEFGLGCSA
jgi:hypothetical protein